MSDTNIEDIIARRVVAILREEGLVVAGGVQQEAAAPAAESAPKKRGPPKQTKPKEVDDPAPDEEENEGEEEEEEEEEDLITDEQLTYVTENIELPDEDAMRAELQDFYEAQGDDAADVQSTLATMQDEELQNAYLDYCARLLVHNDDGSINDLTESMDEPYKAHRVFLGETKLYWVIGGLVMSDEDVEEAGLGDPNAAPKKRPTTRKPAGKKKK